MLLNNRIFGAILINIILVFKRAKSKHFYHDKFESVSNSKICSAFDFNHEYFCSTHAVGFTDSKRQWVVNRLFITSYKASYRRLLRQRAGSRVWFSPYGPFPSTADYCSIGSRIPKKLLKPLISPEYSL